MFCGERLELCRWDERLIQDSAGNLYGTTPYGGANGLGTVFKVDSAGHETVLYSFCSAGGGSCTDGAVPMSGLIRDIGGNLYGTTLGGGTAGGVGTVFKVDTTGQESVLYTFCSVGGGSCTDGWTPSGLLQDAEGNFYGTTTYGGPANAGCCSGNGAGTVFKLDSAGHETTLYAFCFGAGANCTDGRNPEASLIQDSAGNLYGTTYGGGSGDHGTVFKLDSAGNHTVLYNFCPQGGSFCSDGVMPWSLIQDSTGNFYGATYTGGDNSLGTVFEVDNSGNETLLYSFCPKGGSLSNCTDGANPLAGLVRDSEGILYGTTSHGGANATTYGGNGGGTVFKLPR